MEMDVGVNKFDELMTQSMALFFSKHGNLNPADITFHLPPEILENYGKLIVKECIKIMVDHSDRPAGVVKRNVKEHFGVEE